MGIPYLRVLTWMKENKLIVLRDSRNRVLINVDRFMSSLRPDLNIGYTVRCRASERRDPVEQLEQDWDASETPAAPSEASERPARTPRPTAPAPASRTRRRTKAARTQGVTSVPVSAGEPS